MRTATKLDTQHFLLLVSEDVFHARADKRVMAGAIDHEYQVREAVDQPAGKFLLLIEASLHLAALGNIHQGAVIANDAAAGVPYRSRGIQADERPSILARERNFASLHHGLIIDFLAKGATLLFIRKQIDEGARQQLFLRVITEHARQRRVGID